MNIPVAQMNEAQLRQHIQDMENVGNALMVRFLDYARENRPHPIDRMIAACQANDGAQQPMLDARQAVIGLLRAKRARHCYMCSGRGHWADKCPLRKEVDRAFRNTPVMAVWSQVKTVAFN